MNGTDVVADARIRQLLEILCDKNAPVADRDDAAIDLSEYDSDEAIAGIYNCAVDKSENETVLSSCGESLAIIWLRLGRFDIEKISRLTPAATKEVSALFRKERPEWTI